MGRFISHPEMDFNIIFPLNSLSPKWSYFYIFQDYVLLGFRKPSYMSNHLSLVYVTALAAMRVKNTDQERFQLSVFQDSLLNHMKMI
jgi:hypothetical protein